jgi:hypothetical protein
MYIAAACGTHREGKGKVCCATDDAFSLQRFYAHTTAFLCEHYSVFMRTTLWRVDRGVGKAPQLYVSLLVSLLVSLPVARVARAKGKSAARPTLATPSHYSVFMRSLQRIYALTTAYLCAQPCGGRG